MRPTRREQTAVDEQASFVAGSDAVAIPRREFTKRAAIAGLGLSGLSSVLAACGGGSTGSGKGAAGLVAPAHATGHIDALGFDLKTPTPAGDALNACRSVWLKANPRASLTFQPAGFDNYQEIVITRSRAQRLGDVIELLPEDFWANLFPALRPLTREMFPDLKDALSLWDSTTISADNPNRHAGVPIGATGAVWYYNKALFQKAGLDPETVPTTWEHLAEMIRQIKAAGIVPVAFSNGADTNVPFNLWAQQSVQFFPTVADLNAFRKGEIPLTDERFVDSLEPLVQANKDGWWRKDFLGLGFLDAQAEFAQGKTALIPGFVGGAVNWTVWDQKLGKDAYGVFAAPLMPKAPKQIFYWAPNDMYGINKDARNVPAALSFINFLGSKEGMILGLKLGGALPNRTDVDVAAITRSKGAAEIARLSQAMPRIDTTLSYLSPAAATALGKTLGPTIANGDIKGFLSNLQQQQKA